MNAERHGPGRYRFRSAAWRLYLPVGAIGLVLAAVVGYGFYTGVRMSTLYAPLIDAAMEVKLEATTAHLWFEEILSNDRHEEDTAVVWEHLDQAEWYARAMLEGGENPEGTFKPLDDAKLRRQIRDVLEKLAELREITDQRLGAKEVSGPGSDMDRRCSAVFATFMNAADEVETELRRLMAEDLRGFRWTQVSLIGACVLLALCAGIVLRRFEGRRAADWRALSEANERLGREMAQRKQAEEALRELARFPGENPNPVLRVAADGEVLYANPASAPLLAAWGCRQGEALSGRWQEFVADALSSGRSQQAEAECGDRVRALTFAPVAHAGFVNVYGLDITERRRTEEQLRRAARLESIGKLAGGVAHDFNNLLTGILGYSDFLLDDLPDGSPLRKDVEEIRSAGKRAAALTLQLLAFGRKQVLEPKVLDLNTVVSNISRMLRRVIGEDVEMATILAPRLGRVKADPAQIEQVIMNLAVNARDAMPEGGKLTIETADANLDATYVASHAPVRPGRYVMLAVTDTGCGMDEAAREHAFEPFFTTKERGKGTGLGLASVYGIVKQHEGYIWAYSEPGKGTTLKVYLPRVEAEAEVATATGFAEEAPGGVETILVVEDEEAVRHLARRILEAKGYDVLTAGSADEAAGLMAEHGAEVALLLTDVVLPGRSGSALSAELGEGHPSLKILYTSGYADNAIVHQGVLDPGTPFLAKPFTPQMLLHNVRQVLDS